MLAEFRPLWTILVGRDRPESGQIETVLGRNWPGPIWPIFGNLHSMCSGTLIEQRGACGCTHTDGVRLRADIRLSLPALTPEPSPAATPAPCATDGDYFVKARCRRRSQTLCHPPSAFHHHWLGVLSLCGLAHGVRRDPVDAPALDAAHGFEDSRAYGSSRLGARGRGSEADGGAQNKAVWTSIAAVNPAAWPLRMHHNQ